MRKLNKKGISLIEAIASIVIISFVMVTSFTIIVNISNQTNQANERINAVEVGTMIRDNIINDLSYSDLLLWLDTDKIITNENCLISSAPFLCEIFSVTLDGTVFDDIIEITFYKPSSTDLSYGIINFKVSINYYSDTFVELVGVVYE